MDTEDTCLEASFAQKAQCFFRLPAFVWGGYHGIKTGYDYRNCLETMCAEHTHSVCFKCMSQINKNSNFLCSLFSKDAFIHIVH